jgi:hypothetical protein
MDTAQVMEIMKSVLAKMDDIKEIKEKMNASQARTDDNHEKRMAMIRAWRQTDNEEEAMACEEKTEVRLEEEEEPTSVEMKPEVAHEQEVPVQDAEVVPVGEPAKKRRDRRRLAAVRRQKEKDRSLDVRCRGKEQGLAQWKDGCRRNLVAARRGTTRCAGRAWRKEDFIGSGLVCYIPKKYRHPGTIF